MNGGMILADLRLLVLLRVLKLREDLEKGLGGKEVVGYGKVCSFMDEGHLATASGAYLPRFSIDLTRFPPAWVRRWRKFFSQL